MVIFSIKMKTITFADKDIAEVNMMVAEQSLIKASVEDGESQVKALIIARNSIDIALVNLGFDIKKDKALLKNN